MGQSVDFLFVLVVGLIAGTVSGIVGTGSSIMLVPVLVYEFGPKEAVPIMAVAAIMANLSRIVAWWGEVNWRACVAYSVTGIPAAALGARTLLILPSRVVDIAIGLFLILMIPTRRWLTKQKVKLTLIHLAIVGAIVGFLTGIVVSTGPISVSIFITYGLVKGAFLATEAASSLAVFVSKAVTFQLFGALAPAVIAKGLITGTSLMAGAFIAKGFVLRLDPSTFRAVMDVLLFISGWPCCGTRCTRSNGHLEPSSARAPSIDAGHAHVGDHVGRSILIPGARSPCAPRAPARTRQDQRTGRSRRCRCGATAAPT
jgi:uncharacterized membrane protein YfcA